MMDFNWDDKTGILIVHFKIDDQAVDDFAAYARELGYDIIVSQEAGQESVIAKVYNLHQKNLFSFLSAQYAEAYSPAKE